MNATSQELVSEMNNLRRAVEQFRARLIDAQERRTQAMDEAGVPVQYGLYVLDSKDEWRYPSVQAATSEVRRLSDDNGYYWACSRLSDLENLVGRGQMPIRIGAYIPLFGGDIPPAHEAVSNFLQTAGNV